MFDPAPGVESFRRVGLVNANGELLRLGDHAGDGIRFVKGKLYRLVARPYSAFKPDRIVISPGSTPGGANDWSVHDIIVGNRSQLLRAGAIPGGVFSAEAVDCAISFETVQSAMDLSIDVMYEGPNESEPFVCSAVGLSVSA